jgi:hypothetical protein
MFAVACSALRRAIDYTIRYTIFYYPRPLSRRPMYHRQVRHLRWFLITVSDGRRARHRCWRRFVRSSVRNWSLTGRARSSSNCSSGQSIEVKDRSEGRSYITYALNYLEDPACLNIWRRCYNSMNDVRTPSLASSTCRTREKKYRGIVEKYTACSSTR